MIGMNNSKALSVFAALVLLATTGTTSSFQLGQQRQQLRSFGSTLAEQGSAPAPLLGSEPRRVSKGLSASSTASDNEDRVLDTEAIAKYAGAVGTQMLLITAFLKGLDALTSVTNIEIPFAANFILFFGFALKSRAFNPLLNDRPKPATQEVESSVEPPRKMAEWTPPGIFFPIMWVLIIAPLRAFSTALLVTGADGSYCTTAVLALMLHLSIGDTWNTINNIERRYGTSVVGVACVWLSAAYAAYSYGTVDPLAGKLLSLPVIWLTIASSLIFRNWQLNPSEITGEKESLLPTKPSSQDGSITKLVWFEGGNE